MKRDASIRRKSRMRRAGLVPLSLVAVSLVALAILPEIVAHNIDRLETEIRQDLEPARKHSQTLTLLHARQLGRFESYMLTGDPQAAERYQDLRRQEESLSDSLTTELAQADMPEAAELMATLHSASQEWHLAHLGRGGPLENEQGRTAYLDVIGEDVRRYEQLLVVSQDLERAIDDQVTSARAEMDEARATRRRLSIALAVLALGATLAVGVVGRRLGALVNEAEERGSDALRARRKMEGILEASADGVVGMDLAGRCTSLNRTGSLLLGMSDHDAVGRSAHDLIHGKAPPERAHDAEACPVLRALDSGIEQQDPDDQVWRRDGTSFPARWHLRPLVDGREVRGGVLTITDMTDVREAEEALRQAVRARDEMVAIVSHDLRNPLGTVSAAADLLVDLPLPQDKREEQLAIIRRASRRMSRLIDDLLDVARIEAGVLAVEPEPVTVEPLVEDGVALARPQAVEAGVDLEAVVEPGLPPILADRSRIEQVLTNLLANAVKFTPSGGRVQVEAARTRDGVRLSVIDTGPGIDAEDLTRLFDRFWQLERGGREGAGLGLAIVKGIVDAHGGRVWVESEVGRGSAFHVEIPAAPPSDGAEGSGVAVEAEAEA